MTSYNTLRDRFMREAPAIAKEAKVELDKTERVIICAMNRVSKGKRQPSPPAPEGGINLSAASRKYTISKSTLCRWVQKQYIPVVLRTSKELYVDESVLAKVINTYKKNPGQGKRTINPDNGS